MKCFIKGINSSVIIKFNTSQRFDIKRVVRQGCPISPFLFILVVELLSINIARNPDLKRISIFDREIKTSQLADDTALSLKDRDQLSKAIELVSSASGLKLIISKCELLPLHDCEDTSIENVSVKNLVKYLGIYLTRNLLARQHLNFNERIN